ncbi:meckelin isoform X1 [Hylaeus volcanicus]|uniref:meckelin isoform X1 n=1 Tax=Hylaeus volcanicus TaxID=313075 RepID=UPI0023B7F016|nr:meckelin isoform X1 [Hylaeus volcanicus]
MYYLPCPVNTYPSLDGPKCLLCKDFEYNSNVNYTYLSKYYAWMLNQCLYENDSSGGLDTSIMYLTKMESQYTDSYYFRNELQPAIYFCKRKHGLACEHLSNMCALSLYSNKIACMLFLQMQTPIWLFYNKNETTAVLGSKQITQKYSLSKHNNDSTLNFTFATFSLNGNFKSIGIPNVPCNLLKYVRFGINLKKKCKLPIRDLLTAEVELISPYLTFAENTKILTYALPVLIKNINQNENEISHWQFVRKFFFVDNISGYNKTSNFTDSKAKNTSILSTLRYMNSLNVIINVQNVEEKNKIFPPLLIIEYTELTHEQISETVEVTLNYKIQFILNKHNADVNFKIIVGVFSGLALSFSGIKTWSRSKQHNTTCSLTILIWFFIYAMGAVGSVIILSLISLCIYLFIFYKGQTIPHILLFDNINEKTIKLFTTIAFTFKFIEMLGFICQHWNINIFFMDWEQPKPAYNQLKYDPPYISLYKLHTNKLSENKYESLQTISEIITTKQEETADQSNVNHSTAYTVSKSSPQKIIKHNNLSVSIWRTYFIANQWLKLQTKRKINMIVQLVAVLCIFQIVQLYPWIITIPEFSSNFHEDNCSFTLYYTICTVIYVLIYCVQWLLSITFYERYITNRMQNFIDLCSIANISVFILPFNYYGFYIHGRSVHGFADTDLPTLINDLEKEKNNLCAHRGLVPGTSQQTFILSLTKTFRMVFATLTKQTQISSNRFLKTYFFSTENWEQSFNIQFKVKQFLCKFVDHCFKDVDYIIKEQHFFERLCNILFLHSKEKSIFYIDNNHSFDQILFYGNEWLLATFEMSLFTFMVVLCKDCLLAIIVTVSVSLLLIIIVKHNRLKSLSNNALLDKTFLT